MEFEKIHTSQLKNRFEPTARVADVLKMVQGAENPRTTHRHPPRQWRRYVHRISREAKGVPRCGDRWRRNFFDRGLTFNRRNVSIASSGFPEGSLARVNS